MLLIVLVIYGILDVSHISRAKGGDDVKKRPQVHIVKDTSQYGMIYAVWSSRKKAEAYQASLAELGLDSRIESHAILK